MVRIHHDPPCTQPKHDQDVQEPRRNAGQFVILASRIVRNRRWQSDGKSGRMTMIRWGGRELRYLRSPRTVETLDSPLVGTTRNAGIASSASGTAVGVRRAMLPRLVLEFAVHAHKLTMGGRKAFFGSCFFWGYYGNACGSLEAGSSFCGTDASRYRSRPWRASLCCCAVGT